MWFKVDDGFYSSRKVTLIPRSKRWAAIGLWTLTGTWCAKELTDGVLPDYQFEELGGRGEDAAELIAAGLWERLPTGYRFLKWAEYQPTKAEIEDSRQKEADRKKRWRDAQMSQRTRRGTDDGRDGGLRQASGHPDPTRPDPTNKEKDTVRESFELWWSEYPRKEGKAAAEKAYRKALKAATAPQLLAGLRAYKLAKIGTEKAFIKMPAGWLNEGRWADDPVVAESRDVPRSAAHNLAPSAPQPPRQDPTIYCRTHEGYPVPCAACEREGGNGEF